MSDKEHITENDIRNFVFSYFYNGRFDVIEALYLISKGADYYDASMNLKKRYKNNSVVIAVSDLKNYLSHCINLDEKIGNKKLGEIIIDACIDVMSKYNTEKIRSYIKVLPDNILNAISSIDSNGVPVSDLNLDDYILNYLVNNGICYLVSKYNNKEPENYIIPSPQLISIKNHI